MCIYSYLDTPKQTRNTSVNITYQQFIVSNDLSLHPLFDSFLFPRASFPSWSVLPLLQSLLLLLQVRCLCFYCLEGSWSMRWQASPIFPFSFLTRSSESPWPWTSGSHTLHSRFFFVSYLISPYLGHTLQYLHLFSSWFVYLCALSCPVSISAATKVSWC